MDTYAQRTKAALAALLIILTVSILAAPSRAALGSWSGGGPKAKSIFDIEIDTANPSVIYAAAMGSGVFKTTDAGATWDPSTTGLTNTYVRCLAIFPLNHAVVFAGTNDGLFRSTDAGITWTIVAATPTAVRTIAFDAVNPNLVYIGSIGSGVQRSTNGGLTWQPSNAGLADLNVRSIATHPVAPNSAFAGSGTNGGVSLSSTGGLFWGLVADPDAHGSVSDLEFDPTNPARIYAGMMQQGVIRSTDGGVNWTPINTGLPTLRSRALALADTLRYLGTDSMGVYYSTLHTSWVTRSAGLPSLLIRALHAIPGSPRTVFAGTDGAGLFKSTDAGTNWSPLNNLLTDTTPRALLVRNDATHTVVCGTGFGDGIWTTPDGGLTWSRSLLDTRNSVLDLAEPGSGSPTYAAIYGSGVYRSLDGGATWAPTDTLSLGNKFVRCLSISPANPLEIVAGTGSGTWRTLNGGTSWSAWNNGFPAAASVRALVRSPLDPNVIVAGTDSSGVYRTTNGGATWAAANGGLAQVDIHTLNFSPNAARLLCGTETGLYRSTNAGVSWTPYGTGLPPNASIRRVICDPLSPSTVFAGIWEGGVYRSENGGASWTAMNTSLPDLKVYELAWDASSRTLYVGTRLRGMFAYTVATTGVEDPAPLPVSLLQLSARPNPTTAASSLSFRLPADGPVRLSVFDASGTLVRTLLRGPAEAGEHQVAWDGRAAEGRALPGGIYWARLETAGASQATKIVLVR
jgi:photosystem II stability/assembly factor-like uncharacterized protein